MCNQKENIWDKFYYSTEIDLTANIENIMKKISIFFNLDLCFYLVETWHIFKWKEANKIGELFIYLFIFFGGGLLYALEHKKVGVKSQSCKFLFEKPESSITMFNNS